MDFILGPLYNLFGWLTRIFFGFFGNYGVAIIVLTIVIRGLLIPLNIRSQKSMIKMQAMQGKTMELQRKYGDNKDKYNEELMKMQKENGIGGLSGCILPIIQIFLIWPMFRIVSAPMIYLSGVAAENVNAMIEIGKNMGILDNAVSEKFHIGLISALDTHSEFFNTCIEKGHIAMGQMIDLHFMGMDLTKTPAFNPVTIFSDPKTYIPLFMIPIIVLILNIISMQMTKFLKPGYKEEKEARERAKKNAAMSGQVAQDSTEITMKIMNWMMPAIMLFTTFTMPAAMGLYWVVGSIMGILTQILVYYMFTKPYQLKKAEVELKKENAFRHKKTEDPEPEQEEGRKSGKKNRKKFNDTEA
ncbi:MAG: YidC/Oxa1 family membrane protein insertase [Clostridiales bacterium]|nr:YidC/Oxa1 family membrane protein insertase [Clostridiales bacterium]